MFHKAVLLVAWFRCYIFWKRYTQDDWPYTTELILEEGAAGKTDIAALVVMDGIMNARVSPPSGR